MADRRGGDSVRTMCRIGTAVGLGWMLLGDLSAPAAANLLVPADATGTTSPRVAAAARIAATPTAQNARRAKAKAAASKAGQARKPEDPLAKLPPGPLQIIISLDDQRLALYAGGQLVARSTVSTGVPGHPTPTGVFSVIQKNRHHLSNIYSGAPMPFMQRITWSGIALHQGVVPGRPASHGCIRLPAAFASQLWGITRLGARVIIARNEVTPVEIEHARLFVLKRLPNSPPEMDRADAGRPLRTAQADTITSDATRVVDTKTADPPQPAAVLKLSDMPLRAGPVSVFISAKEKKLYVRKGFAPVFEAPVTIERPGEPLGTHAFTALSFLDDRATLRWTAVTLPNRIGKAEPARRGKASRDVAPPAPEPVASTPAEALDRITIPKEAKEWISELVSPGASLVISDNGMSHETGKETDFVVLTR